MFQKKHPHKIFDQNGNPRYKNNKERETINTKIGALTCNSRIDSRTAREWWAHPTIYTAVLQKPFPACTADDPSGSRDDDRTVNLFFRATPKKNKRILLSVFKWPGPRLKGRFWCGAPSFCDIFLICGDFFSFLSAQRKGQRGALKTVGKVCRSFVSSPKMAPTSIKSGERFRNRKQIGN